jgi:hypothetical protein
VRTGNAAPVTIRDGARATIACLEMLDAARTRAPRAIDLERLLAVSAERTPTATEGK